jgi:hypothetical protein
MLSISNEGIERAWIIVNGIDRVDNSIGYIKSNSVTCCSQCNFAKNDISLYEWLSYLERFQSNYISKILIKLMEAGIKIPAP